MKNTSSSDLENLIKNDDVFKINERTIKQFSRISKISQMVSLASWEEVEWLDERNLDKSKLKSPEVIETANIIIRKIEEVLWVNASEIWWSSIEKVAIKVWDKLISSWNVEDFIIWNYVKRIAYQVSNIHLRYQRYTKHIENRELKIKNRIDNLTWLLTKQSINNYIDYIVERKSLWSDNWNYWVILMDIDYFKVLNDNFWHVAWDIVLEEISNIFKKLFRETDKVARWWWEEFLVIMKWWDTKSYTKKINRVREYIDNNLLNIVNSRIIREQQIKPITLKHITISAWITMLANDDCLTSVTKRADEALYSSKWSWRNSVTLISKYNSDKEEDCETYCPTWCQWNEEIKERLVKKNPNLHELINSRWEKNNSTYQ